MTVIDGGKGVLWCSIGAGLVVSGIFWLAIWLSVVTLPPLQ